MALNGCGACTHWCKKKKKYAKKLTSQKFVSHGLRSSVDGFSNPKRFPQVARLLCRISLDEIWEIDVHFDRSLKSSMILRVTK